jgi:hypothetical protein
MAINTNKTLIRLLLVSFLGLPVSFCLAESTEPSLVGITAFSKLYREQYIAALYHAENGINDQQLIASDSPKQMVILVSAEQLSARKFRMEWGAAIEINNQGQPDYEKVALKGGGLDEFLSLPKAAAGGKLVTNDVIQVELSRSTRSGNLNTLIKYNDKVVMAKKGASLFRVLLRCWIGKKPPTADFKKQLLGLEQIRNHEELLFYLRSATRSS